MLTKYLKVDAVDFQQTLDEALAFGEYVEPMKSDVAGILHELRKQGKRVLFEGAQGSLLDIDHGTYPYVTSSNTTVGGALAGTGVGADAIDYVLGIAKAYATRVGGGPFPTELDDEVGEGIRKRGQEFGATTGRPRRCGWIDIVALKRAVAINGITGLCITKLDILDGMQTLKMCIAYEYRGKRTEYAPLDAAGWDECSRCTSSSRAGTKAPHGITEWDKLPAAARAWICARQECGAATGRPRRCGWMDIIALKRAVAINGITGLCITKLDILDGMEKLKICIAYEYRGKRTEYAPLDAAGWEECTPVYLEFPGWNESTHGITEWDKLPAAARAYLRALEELSGCPLAMVSTGPDRDANIVLEDPWA